MKKPKWWGLVAPTIVVLIVISFIPLAAVYVAKSSQSTVPRLSIIRDMDNQPRLKAQQPSQLFADGRAMRRPVAGTVSQGTPISNPHLTQGIIDDQWATTLPPEIDVNAELLARGQNRFSIYCAVCHGHDGSGKGAVDARAVELEEMAWISPSSYHTDTVRNRPVGHIFNTITNGIRTMPPYAKQLDYYDRWAVVAYVRALQRSKNAELEDAPDEERRHLASMELPTPTEADQVSKEDTGDSAAQEDSAAIEEPTEADTRGGGSA